MNRSQTEGVREELSGTGSSSCKDTKAAENGTGGTEKDPYSCRQRPRDIHKVMSEIQARIRSCQDS